MARNECTTSQRLIGRRDPLPETTNAIAGGSPPTAASSGSPFQERRHSGVSVVAVKQQCLGGEVERRGDGPVNAQCEFGQFQRAPGAFGDGCGKGAAASLQGVG